MKNKKILYAMIPVLGLVGLFGARMASANGIGFGGDMSIATPEEIATRQQTMFQREATMLGISVDEVKAAWAAGKNVQDIIKEKNLNTTDIEQRMKDGALAHMKSQFQTLVSKGIITQAQADSRLKFMQDRSTNMKGGMGMHGMRGGFHGFGGFK